MKKLRPPNEVANAETERHKVQNVDTATTIQYHIFTSMLLGIFSRPSSSTLKCNKR